MLRTTSQWEKGGKKLYFIIKHTKIHYNKKLLHKKAEIQVIMATLRK